MSLPHFLNCMLGRHDPKRGAVRWDGREYVGRCRHCNKPIRRIAHRVWRTREA